MANLTGTTGNETITGTAGADSIVGNGGSDTLIGAGGNDTIWGDAAGADVATDPADSIDGGAGDDSLAGGGGDDTIHGGLGNDTFNGGQGQDVGDYRDSTGAVVLTNSNQYSFTGSDGLGGIDSMTGVDDFLLGSGNDKVDATGSSWYHRIEGNAGNDSLTGSTSTDTLVGGTGDDVLVGAAGNDLLDGGEGNDVADYSASASAVNLVYNPSVSYKPSLNATANSTAPGFTGADGTGTASGTDTILGVETIRGGSAADTINATGATDALYLDGGAGADSLTGGSGNDTLVGGAGNDTITGGGGTDTFTVGGPAAGYTVTFGKDTGGTYALVTDTNTANGDDGADKVYSAEALRFSDGTTRNIGVTTPTLAFNDANGRLNAAEAGATPVTIAGLAAGETAVVTFRSSAGTATTTATFSGNGQVNVNLSGLADGTITITQVAVTSGGTTNTFLDPASGTTVALDRAAPAAPVISTVTDNVGTGNGRGPVSNGATTDDNQLDLVGTAEAGATVAVFNGATQVGTATADGSGAWSLTTATLPDGPVSLTAIATDTAGNVSGASAARTSTMEATAPTVSSVAYGANDGALAAGETVTLAVQFSENVLVAGGTPTLTLNNGAAATYTGGSGTSALVFTYTAAAGQTVADLAVTAFNLNNATVRDSAGKAANTTGAVANPAGILAVDTAAPNAPSITGVTDDAGAVVGPVAAGAVTDDTTPTVAVSLSGTNAVAGDIVRLLANGVQVGSATLAAADISAGTVSLTSSALSGDGAKNLTATVTDAAGNVSTASAARSLVLDTTAPSETSTIALVSDTGSSASDGVTFNPALSGTVSGGASGVLVTILDGGTVVGTATTGAGGAWTFANAAATESAHSYTAAVTDAAGNRGTPSAALAVTLDKTAPTATTTVALASDTGASNTDGVTSNPALTGTGPANATIVVKDGATVLGSATANASGVWSFTPTGTAALDGAHSYTAQVADPAGNLGPASAALPVTLDKAAPGKAAIGTITDDRGAVTGTVTANGTTDDATPTVQVLLSGTGAVAGDTVTVAGASITLTAAHISAGSVSFDVPLSGDGAKSLTATITDKAGNASAPSGAVNIVVDTAAPNAPSITGVTDDQAPKAGSVAEGGPTNDTTPTVAVSLSGTNAVAGDTVRLLANGAQVAATTLTATDIAAGTVSLTASALSGDGAKALTATVTDAAGNASAASPAFGVVLDTTAPSAPSITGVTDSVGAVRGQVADGASTDDAAPTVAVSLAGTGAVAGDVVRLRVDGVLVASEVLTAADITAGTVSLASSALSGDGAKAITAYVTDAAGYASAFSAARTLVLDTAAPAAPAITGVTDDAGSVTGTVAAGAGTDDATPTVAVSLAGTGAAAGDTVRLFADGAQVAAATLTAADIAAGTASVTSSALSGDGAKTLTATVTDAAGNASPASAGRDIVLDTTAPGAPAITGAADDSAPNIGPVATGGATNDTTPTLSGTAEANSTVAVFDGSTRIGTATASASGAWTFTPGSALAEGAHSFTARAIDAAGNQGAASAAYAVTVDTAPPANTTTLALSEDTGASTSDGVTSNPALTGTVSGAAAGLQVTILEGATVIGTASIGTGGAWTFANATATNGAHAYTAVVTDAAGNRGPASAALSVTLDKSAPAAPIIATVTDDAGAITGTLSSGNTTDDRTLALAGTAEAGATVAVFNGATLVGTTTADGGGAWSLTTAALAEGAASLTARATNASGVQGAASAAFTATVDTAAPAAPTIATATDDAGAVTGALSNGAATDDTALRLAGTAEAGATVAVYNGAALVGTTTADGGGAWSLTTAALPEGAASLTARATDAAGNQGAASAAFSATVDTTDPAATSIAASGAGITAGGGSLGAGKTVTLTVAAGEALFVTGTPTLALNNGGTATYAGGSGTAALAFTYTVAAGEDTADLRVSAMNLPGGATIRDAAGNNLAFNAASVWNPPGTLAIDTVAPGEPRIVSVTDDAAPETGNVFPGEVTNDATPVVRVSLGGTGAAAGNAVQVLVDSAVAGSATVTAADITAGYKDVTATLAGGDGPKSLTATVTDAAGNASAASTAFSVVLDTEAPTATPTIGFVSDTGAAGDGVTSDPVLTGTAPAGATVLVKDGAAVLGTATADGRGVWTFTPTGAAAADGDHSFTAAVADAAGNLGPAAATSPAVTTVDATASSAPSITGVADDLGPVTGAVAAGAATDDTTPTVAVSLAGTGAAAGDTVKLFAGGAQVASATLSATDIANNTVSLTSSALSGDGAKSLTATVTDAAGNASAASAVRSIVLDTAAPAAPVITGATDDQAPNTGAVAAGGATDDTTPTLAGTAEAGATVAVYDGSTLLGTATASGSGTWSFTPGTALAQGGHSFTARAIDAAGNQGAASTAYAVTVDTAAPNAPSITGVTDDAGAVTGAVAAGAATDDTTPTVAVSLSGTNAVAGDTVALLVGGTQVASKALTAADISAGTVSLTSSSLSGDGAKAITATVTDAAGNASAATAARTFTVDTAPPATPVIGSVGDNVGASTGALANGAATDDNTLTLAGTAEAGSTVKVFNGSTQVATATADSSGNWTATTAALPDGAVSLTATATDAAGNPSAASAARTATVDTGAPAAPAAVGLANDTGASGTDGVTSDPTIRGTAEPGATVTLKVGATVVGTGTANGSGDFSITPTGLAEGATTIAVTATDAAGNTGPAATVSFTLDTAAPTTTATIALVADTGASGTDGVTANPALTGTGPANATVVVKDGASVVGTATTDADGAWTLANAGAAQGAHAYTAQVADAAGNLGPASTPLAVTLDTAAPTETTTVSLVADTGASNTDGLTSNPALTGTVSSGAAGVTVTILEGGAAVGTATTGANGAWSFANAGAAQGAHLYTAAVTDAAGNRGPAAATSPATVTLDSAAPTATVAITGLADDAGPTTGTVADGGATDDATPLVRVALTGAAAGDTVRVLSDGAAAGSATLTAADIAAGYVDVAATLAGDGAKSLTAVVVDPAGNASAPSAARSVTLDTAAPTDTATVGLVSDTGASGTDGVTSNPALTGTGPANATVVVKDGGAVVATVTTDANGVWTLANAGASDGSHIYTAQVADAAGNLGPASQPLAVTLDTAAPTATATIALVADTGTSNTDGVTSNPALAGTGPANATIVVKDGNAVLGTATADGSGAWTFTPTGPAASDGSHSYTAQVADAAGNLGPATAPLAVTLEGAAPTDTATVRLVSDTGDSSTDGITANPALTGTGPANATVVVKDGGTVVGTATTGANGVWTLANAGAAYGAHSYTAQVADADGNLGPASAALAVEVSRAGDDDLSFLETSGADGIAGEGGSDTVTGGEGDDTLWGDDAAGNPAEDGDDSLTGGGGDDLIEGGGGADVLAGGLGADTVQGGDGDDTIEGSPDGDAGDLIDGGEGRDEFSYFGPDDDVVVDLAAGTTSSGATLVSIEDVWTDGGNDLVRGNADANRLRGWDGDDTLEGAAGNDTLEGGRGDDALTGGRGDDTLDGGAGVDTAVFAGNKAGYTVTSGMDEGGQFFTVVDTDARDGDDGTDKVYGAEFLSFADQTDPVCFMTGTLVATPSGERPVETLAAGDLVLTADGTAAPVRWLGRQTVSTRFADPLRVLPVRVAAGALGENLPKRDLLLSADHALLLDGALVQAGALVNGTTIRREAGVPEVFTYWHVELADHALVLAEGVAAESFIDNVARLAFDNWAEHEAAADPAPMAEMALPRAKSHRQVPSATRRRLAERAALLLGEQTAAA